MLVSNVAVCIKVRIVINFVVVNNSSDDDDMLKSDLEWKGSGVIVKIYKIKISCD